MVSGQVAHLVVRGGVPYTVEHGFRLEQVSGRKIQGFVVHAGFPDVGKDDVGLDQVAGQGFLAVRCGPGELLTAGKPEQGIEYRGHWY